MATNITISTSGTTTVVTVPSVSNNISISKAAGGSNTFIGLNDTPSSFTASKFLKVNSGGTAVEFVDTPGASSLNELSDVSTTGGANGDVLVRNSSGNYTTSQNLQELRSLLKTGTGTTTLTGDGSGSSTDDGRLELTSTAGKVKFATNSEMELTATTAKLKAGVTELKITETSPGDIEFIVATDASGSTAFTAVHIDGTTKANATDVMIKNRSNLKIESSSASANLRYTGSGNANLTLPSSTGTLALTSQITADTNTQNSYTISCVDGDNSDEEKIRLTQSGADGAATDDIVLEAGTGLSIARAGDKITFTNTVSDTNTMGGGFTVSATTDTTATTITEGDDLFFAAGTGITCETTSDGTVTISSTITDTNTQNAYAISCVDGDNSDEEKIRLTQSGAAGSATDDIVLEAGTGLSIARSGDKITFTNTVTDTNTTDLVTDTSPQLGGNLDVNGNDIVSTSNADIELDPNGTGKVVFKGNSDKGAGQFVLNCEQNSHGIVIKGPPHSAGASYTLTLPNTDGSANEVLKTDGSGNLDWVAQTDTNLGSTDQTLSGTRNIDMGSNFLTFKSGSNLRMQYDPNDDRFEFNNGLRVNGSFITADGGLNAGLVKFNEPTQGGTNGVILRGPSTNLTSDVTFVLPDADGSAGQFLKTDGGGNLSFASAGGSGSTTFLGLTDTPSSFTASKFLKVNSAGNAVEFVDGGGSGISNVVEDTTPQLGGDLDTNGKNVLFAKTSNTDNSSNGDIVKIGSGSTTQGELCYYTSSGTWVAADADAAGTAGGVLLAIALGTDPDVDGMLLRGMYTLDHDPGTVGDELYVSTTAGDITSTAPSGTGDIVRVVGYCLDSTNGQIWFNPSNDFITLA